MRAYILDVTPLDRIVRPIISVSLLPLSNVWSFKLSQRVLTAIWGARNANVNNIVLSLSIWDDTRENNDCYR